METIGIIGAGQMGAGIAQVVAASGRRVILTDRDLAIAEQARAGIGKRLQRLVEKDKLGSADAEAALARIEPAGDYSPMANAALIIEAATENERIKQTIFADAAKVLAPDAVLASNTSSISITRMAAGVPDPARFIGLHFFNPVPVMGLVELIPGLATDPAVVDRMRAFAADLGKQVVMSRDAPGFIVNRVLMPMINEAVFVAGDGTASIADIDAGCRLGLNHPMGPLELADFIGLDTCLEIMRVLFTGTGDTKYRPAPLLVQYVDAGWLGKKTGRGFYDWTGAEKLPTR
ncbi:3-hydroxyacyl-CoA dehydrogenase NAD-binding domain-containing protein [Croceibacterium sp. TMG7-5b_MA50]|uniref:3-hydroxyacyl-CoA dehydrogenase family protein n=1 Tax=Croceibacterium sp. TMG7-5b_MA50 TaxID=3121290 RepID=UPI0032219928